MNSATRGSEEHVGSNVAYDCPVTSSDGSAR